MSAHEIIPFKSHIFIRQYLQCDTPYIEKITNQFEHQYQEPMEPVSHDNHDILACSNTKHLLGKARDSFSTEGRFWIHLHPHTKTSTLKLFFKEGFWFFHSPNHQRLKIGHPKREVVFQPSIFRGKLLVFGRVIRWLLSNPGFVGPRWRQVAG